MITLGTNTAADSRGAADWAAREAAELGTTLTVVDSRDASSRPLLLRSLDAEFVVLDARGGADLPRELRTHCPVVFIRDARPEPAKPVVVLGLEPNEDPAPIEFAFRYAARLGCEVRAVRAFEPASAFDGGYVDDVEIGRRDALIGMGSLLRQFSWAFPEVPVSAEAQCADPVHALSVAGREAHLIVVGARRRLGRTVRTLLARDGAPVAAVPVR
ncbi:MAG TPA: hypothetical protein VFN97_25005 [Actinospica sp.]|nr:hypothetical protein [Actinospica sp.]